MKSILILLTALLTGIPTLQAQSTAPDWTAPDCNGNSHHLFDELNEGKIIVFTWVMPCGSCVAPSKTAYEVVQGYAESHPGKVLYYLADDIGDASCSNLSSWIHNNNIGDTLKMTLFSNSGNLINENDFGGSGMPHTVVIGGKDATLYFNQKNGNANTAQGLQAAINDALGGTAAREVHAPVSFTMIPNPATSSLSITCEVAIEQVTLMTMTGQVIQQVRFPKGTLNPSITLAGLATGLYLVRLTDSHGWSRTQKMIKQ